MTFAENTFFQSLNNKSYYFLILAASTVIFASISILPTAHAADVTLAWDSCDGASGYVLYCGIESGTYDDIIDVGNKSRYTLRQLNENLLYYCAVTAYNEFDESGYSSEISFMPGADSGGEAPGAGSGDEPPVADADEDQTVDELDTVILDGSYSSDPDDGIATYRWKQIIGKRVDLSDPCAIEPSFIAPEVGANGSMLIFRLTVTDYSGSADSDMVKIFVNDIDEPAGGEIDEPAGGVDYCKSSSRFFDPLWISRVTLSNDSHSSGASRYSDFTSLVGKAEKGRSYWMRLSTEPKFTTELKYWRVWADYNQDGDFDDPGEKILEGSSKVTVSGRITIPAGADQGDTRLRISMGLLGYPNSCGTFDYGEVEDYTLHISGN